MHSYIKFQNYCRNLDGLIHFKIMFHSPPFKKGKYNFRIPHTYLQLILIQYAKKDQVLYYDFSVPFGLGHVFPHFGHTAQFSTLVSMTTLVELILAHSTG